MSSYKEISKTYRLEYNRRCGHKTYEMRLCGDTSLFNRPGQFVNIAVSGKFLRRPISVADYDGSGLTLLYDVVGAGTRDMSEWHEGENVDILIALGNGFDVTASGSNPLLLGGGIGIAPLYGLAKALLARNIRPTVILGFNTGADVVMLDKFRQLCPSYVATVDGTSPDCQDGDIDVTKGYVTDVIDRYGLGDSSYFYGCGPLPMLRSLCLNLDMDGEVSMEARMGCGFGICMCCSLETRGGARRICKEGPVFRKEELIWK